MEYITKEDEKAQTLFLSCFNNRCFESYYNDAVAEASVGQVEGFVASILDEWANHMQDELDAGGLSPGDKEDLELYEQAKEGEISYLYAWNRIYCDNGETHGTVLAMCFKSAEPILHALGRNILLDLAKIQDDASGGVGLSFDT